MEIIMTTVHTTGAKRLTNKRLFIFGKLSPFLRSTVLTAIAMLGKYYTHKATQTGLCTKPSTSNTSKEHCNYFKISIIYSELMLDNAFNF